MPLAHWTIVSKPAAARPRPRPSPGGKLDTDDSRPQRRELGRAEPPPRERAGAVALREDIAASLADQGAERRGVALVAQIEKRRELAEAGIDLDLARMRQMRSRDLEHVGAVLGERARGGRARQHSRQVEHANAAEWTIACGKRLRRRIADPLDLEEGQAGDRHRLRMTRPLVAAADESGAAGRRVNRVFERRAVGRAHSGGDRGAVGVCGEAEHGERRLAMVGEIAMKENPAVVAGLIEAAHCVEQFFRRLVVDAQIARAAQRRSGVAQIDRDLLRWPAVAQRPELGRGQRRRRDRGRTGRADAKASREHGVVAGDFDLSAPGRRQASRCQNLAESRDDHRPMLEQILIRWNHQCSIVFPAAAHRR
jgi:hypothetical protein